MKTPVLVLCTAMVLKDGNRYDLLDDLRQVMGKGKEVI